LRRRSGKHPQNLPEFSPGMPDGSCRGILPFARFNGSCLLPGLWIAAAMALLKSLARAGKRISLGMNQPFDLQGQLHIAFAVESLPGTTLVGLELRKLRFPEPQNVGLNFANARDIADLEIKTVRDRGRFEGALPG